MTAPSGRVSRRLLRLLFVAALAGCGRSRSSDVPARVEGAAHTDSRADERSAMTRAVAYVRDVPSTNPEAGILIGMLARKFPEAGLPSPTYPPIDSLDTHALVVARFADPVYPVSRERIESERNPINRVVATALYCDRFALPPTFLDDVRALNATGGLYLTHSVLATRWAVENGCLRDADIPADVLADQLGGLQVIESADVTRNHDIRVESMAFLHYLGHPELVPESLVREMLATQNADGGFGGLGPGSPSNHHTTALALWVLLERAHPGRPQRWLP